MDAKTLVHELEARGVTLTIDEGRIVASGNKDAIAAHRAEIRRHKPEIMAFMAKPAISRPVVRYGLKSGDGGGSLLGEPGDTDAELIGILRAMYGDRLAWASPIKKPVFNLGTGNR